MNQPTLLPFDPDVAGVDEAGRGPLAGPLVVAAVLLPRGFDASGLNDSKKLTAAQREAHYLRVFTHARYHIEVVPSSVVDAKNILRATLEAMALCLYMVGAKSARVDGNQQPIGAHCPCETLVQGDGRDAAIAAASILAKVTRDRLMTHAATVYPGYGWETNMGYHVPEHVEAIYRLGPTPLHRRSFDPLRSMLAQPCLSLDA